VLVAYFWANVGNYKSMSTLQQYGKVIQQCEEIFLKKTADYGTAWRVLRDISIVDQIYIKAWRIRTVQELGEQKIDDDICGEFVGIINYSIIGLIQLHLTEADEEELGTDAAKVLYDKYAIAANILMESKNYAYGEAWRQMGKESYVDLILMKLQRMRQILANKGKTLISEGLDANYYDMINYAVFAMILLKETKSEQL